MAVAQYSQPQYEEVHYPHGPIIVRRTDRDELHKSKKDEQHLENIPGAAGVDYPIYHSVPPTSFSCHNVPALPGMYANPETGCQAYHVCHDGREGEQGSSFLCTNGTSALSSITEDGEGTLSSTHSSSLILFIGQECKSIVELSAMT